MNIAILGSGSMGRTHARAFAKQAGVRVAVIASRSLAHARMLADEIGCRAVNDYGDVLRDPGIDAVSITLPTQLHAGMARDALAAGKHVLLEKPMALNVVACDALLAVRKARGQVFMIAHVLRFWPEYVTLITYVKSGALGRPYAVFARRNAAELDPATWFRDPKKSGGALLDLVVHDFDAANWLLGQPRQVSAAGCRGQSGAWDQAHVTIQYQSGHASVECNQLLPAAYPFTMELRVHCERGAAEFHFRAADGPQSPAQSSLRVYRDGNAEALPFETVNAYERQAAVFAECVHERRQPVLGTPRQARDAVAVADAAKLSLKNKQPISVATVSRRRRAAV